MTRFSETVQFAGPVSFLNNSLSMVQAAADALAALLDPDKFKHRHAIHYSQANGSDVASETKLVFLCRAVGVITSIEVRPDTAPTGGDKQYTIDVLKGADGVDPATSLLSSVITVDNTSVDHTLQEGVLIGTPATADGDAIEIVVTVSGSTGSQGDGLVVVINLDEQGT